MNNQIIRASAGSGKTYQLSHRYLGLLANHVPVETILASTFTRKAAGEIQNRILLLAAQVCLDKEKRRELSRNIGSELSEADCLAIFQRLIHKLHRMRVQTLDSFFNRLAHCFSYEIGLPTDWNSLEELGNDERYRRLALRRVLTNNTKSAEEIVHGLYPGEYIQGIAKQIFTTVNDLYTLSREAEKPAWDKIQSVRVPGLMKEDRLQETLDVIQSKATDARLGAGVIKALQKLLQFAQRGEWKGLLLESGVIVEHALAMPYGTFRIGNSKTDLPSDVCNAVRRLATHAVCKYVQLMQEQTRSTYAIIHLFAEEYEKLKQEENAFLYDDIKQAVASFIQDRNSAMDAVFWRLDAPLKHLLLDEFQDTSLDQWHIIQPLCRSCVEKADHSFFCVGDVKQAIYRWRNGRVEIFDSIASTFPNLEEQHSNKSWRSSPAVLDAVNRVFLNPNATDGLNEQNQQAWNEWHFEKHETARTNLPGYWEVSTSPDPSGLTDTEEKLDLHMEYVAQKIAELYRTTAPHTIGVLFRSHTKLNKLMHHLRRLGIPASEEGKTKLVYSQAVRLILSLLTLADHPGDSVAFFHVAHSPLVQLYPTLAWVEPWNRTYDEAGFKHQRIVAQTLREIREDVLALGFGVFVEKLVKFLEPLTPTTEHVFLRSFIELASDYSQRNEWRIRDFVAYIKDVQFSAPEFARISVMTIHQSKGLEFDCVVLPELTFPLAGKPPTFTLGYPNNDVIAQPDWVVRWLDQKLLSKLPESCAPLQAAIDLNRIENAKESFCMLYVAMTRAIHGLYMVMPPAGHTAQTTSSLVLKALVGSTQQLAESRVLASGGDPQWATKTTKAREAAKLVATKPVVAKPTATKSAVAKPTGKSAVQAGSMATAQTATVQAATAQTAAQPTLPLSAPQSAVSQQVGALGSFCPDLPQSRPMFQSYRALKRRSPSGIDENGIVNLERKLSYRRSNTVRGSILHKWYEKIAWTENSILSDDELLLAAAPFALSENMLNSLLLDFRMSLKKPTMVFIMSAVKYLPELSKQIVESGILTMDQIPTNAFAPKPEDPDALYWEVLREKELAIRTETELLLGTVDRLVLLRNAHQVFWADCLDYKTMRKINDDSLDDLVEKHKPQMVDYMNMLSMHYGIPTRQISTRIVFSMLGIVREVR